MEKNPSADLENIRASARKSMDALSGPWGDQDLGEAKALVERLRKVRDFGPMAELAEAVSRADPDDSTNRRLYAQCLIETGKVTAAIDLLNALSARLPSSDPEFSEAQGLLGRAYKQIFLDAGDKSRPLAHKALQDAIAAYREGYRTNPQQNTWHGVNLLALLRRAKMQGLSVPGNLKGETIARTIIDTLEQQEPANSWRLATLAEASLGLGDWSAAESHIRNYVVSDQTDAFQLSSTIRQFAEVWDLEHGDARGKSLLDILRARLLTLQGGALEISPDRLRTIQGSPLPEAGQLEAILGRDGIQTYRWFLEGVTRARSVAAIRKRLGSRVGSGFLVKAETLGLKPVDELFVMTNFHVVNDIGGPDALLPEEAEVVFEAADPGRVYAVKEIVWSSETGQLDASLLRLAEPVTGIEPLPLAKKLPLLEDHPRVYIIGHPGGRDLAISLQDNELMDHEEPPKGKPQIPGVWRVHYHAPTEGGSSGSPVFNASLWQVIALHHMGGKTGMRRLNGQEGTYAANEGIAIQSIAAAIGEWVSAQTPSPQ